MAGATEQEIAACMGHSSTALVRRYAHLSPCHLKGVVEMVSQFGKQEKPIEQSQAITQGGSQPGERVLIDALTSDGTEIKPGIGYEGEVSKDSEVLEKFGGPCRGRTYGPLIKSQRVCSEAFNDPSQFRCVCTGGKARGGHGRAVER